MEYKNFASDSQFYITFTFQNQDFKYFLQSVKLPDFDFGNIQVLKNGQFMAIPGNSKNHNTIPLSFILDEKYYVWTQLIDIQEKIRNKGESLDNVIIVLQNNQYQDILKIEFINAFFTNITGSILDIKSQETEMFVDVTLSFKDVNITRV